MKSSSDIRRKRTAGMAILPPLAVTFFLYSLAIVLGLLIVLDRVTIPYLEDHWKLVSRSWQSENIFLYYSMYVRNKANLKASPIWRSEGFPVNEKSPRRHRILVIGDSFEWGHGYANLNDIWWRQLARELERRGYKDVEVIAAGMQGINTAAELNVAKQVVPKYHPDLVIWGYVTNDPDELSPFTVDDSDPLHVFRYHLDRGFEGEAKGVFPDLGYQLFRMRKDNRRKHNTGHNESEFQPKWERDLFKGDNYARYEKTIAQVGTYLNSLSIPSFVLTLPYECPGPLDFKTIQNHYETVYPPVQKLLEKNHVRFVDALGTWLAAAMSEEKLSDRGILWFGINPANAHPNVWATHSYAMKAADVLERDYPSVLGERSAPAKTAETPHFNDWVPGDMYVRQDQKFTLVEYPTSDDDFRYMPLRQPYVQLNLETPASVKQIRLQGHGLDKASIYATFEDSRKHFDDGELKLIGTKKGSCVTFDVPATAGKLNTVEISAALHGNDRGLLLELIR